MEIMEENSFVGVFHVTQDMWVVSYAVMDEEGLSLVMPLLIKKTQNKKQPIILEPYSPFSEPSEMFIFENFISLSYPSVEIFQLYHDYLTQLYPDAIKYNDSDNNNEEESNGKKQYH